MDQFSMDVIAQSVVAAAVQQLDDHVRCIGGRVDPRRFPKFVKAVDAAVRAALKEGK